MRITSNLPAACVSFWLLIAAAAAPLPAAAQARDFSINYHEPVVDLRMRSRSDLRGLSKPAAPGSDLSFSAFGRTFELTLERNDDLIRNLPVAQRNRLDRVELYRGSVANASGSWVRITRVGDRVSGLIFDGVEYFAIDPAGRVADMLVLPQTDPDGTVIYRLSDTSGPYGDAVLEPAELTSGSTKPQIGSFFPELESKVSLEQRIEIGVVSDVEFSQLAGPGLESEEMVRIINVADGIFLEQLGIHLDLVAIKVYDMEPDPFGSSSPSVLLTSLEAEKYVSDTFRPLGLLHLFTGRDLDDSSPDVQTVGVAHRGVLCEEQAGVGLTQSRGVSTIDGLVAAHEFGHNFGAPHDTESGSVCESAPAGLLMDPHLSYSTEFSQCSIDQMLIEIGSATCLMPLVPANLTLWLLSDAPPPVVFPDTTWVFGIAVDNTSGADAVGVELSVDAPAMDYVVLSDLSGAMPDGCAVLTGGYSCNWTTFANGERFDGVVRFRGTLPGPSPIDVNITSLSESDLTDDSLHFDVDVVPYVNLVSAMTPATMLLHSNETGSVAVTLTNASGFAAHDVVVKMAVGYELEWVGSSLGTCVWDGRPYYNTWDCPVGVLGAGERLEFNVEFRQAPGLSLDAIKDGARVAAVVSSFEPETLTSRENNAAYADITIGDSIGDLGILQFGASKAYVGDPYTMTVKLSNDGPDEVHDVVVDLFEFGGTAQPEIVTFTSTSSSCHAPAGVGGRTCEIAALGVGEEVTLLFELTTNSAGSLVFGTQTDMSSSDPNKLNNGQQATISILAQPPPPPDPPPPTPAPQASGGGGGGGGAQDPLTVALLGLLWLDRRRRAARRAGTTSVPPCGSARIG